MNTQPDQVVSHPDSAKRASLNAEQIQNVARAFTQRMDQFDSRPGEEFEIVIKSEGAVNRFFFVMSLET